MRLLGAALVVLLGASLGAAAQPAQNVRRVGLLTPTPHSAALAGFHEGMRAVGQVAGQSVVIEQRSADGKFDRLPDLAAELVTLRVDVIVAMVTQASLAARGATATIPIVMVGVGDPVGAGLVASLARPGGNVTGTSALSVELAGKSLEVLKQVVPRLNRVAVLWNPANAVFQGQMGKELEAAARLLAVRLHMLGARDAQEIESAFRAIAADRPQALLVVGDPVFTTHRARIVALAAESRLPSVGTARDYAEAGLLMAYAPDYFEAGFRAATQVDRILKGAKPADLPVEQVSRAGLTLNLRAARALGLAFPPALLTRADEVIE